MIGSTLNPHNSVLLQGGHSFGRFLPLEVTMAQLAPVLLDRVGTPGVQVPILVDRGEVVFTRLDLNRLKPRERW